MKPSPAELRARLRDRVASGEALLAPGATDALSARLIESHGFPCVYIGSYATAASRFALPDTGLLSLDELAAQARTIADAVALPVIADAEGGFHDAANIWRTVQAFEQAGVAAIHIEDHAGVGKHSDAPQALRPAAEAAARIRAAVDARRDPNFLVAARSDAFWISADLEETIRRLELYAAAGADLVFPTLAGPDELAEVRRRVARPAMVVDMPGRAFAEAARAGASIVLYYAFSTIVQYAALDEALAALSRGTVPASHARIADLEKLLGYDAFATRSREYRGG